MFHIGIATKHPPLPDPNELSDLGIDFIRQALILDPTKRPTAAELLNHEWMKDLARCLSMMESGEDEMMWSNSIPTNPNGHHDHQENANVGRRRGNRLEQPLNSLPEVDEVEHT